MLAGSGSSSSARLSEKKPGKELALDGYGSGIFFKLTLTGTLTIAAGVV